jgi:hypothetical protein
MLQASHDPGVDPADSHVALPRPEFLPELTGNLIQALWQSSISLVLVRPAVKKLAADTSLAHFETALQVSTKLTVSAASSSSLRSRFDSSCRYNDKVRSGTASSLIATALSKGGASSSLPERRADVAVRHLGSIEPDPSTRKHSPSRHARSIASTALMLRFQMSTMSEGAERCF